MKLKEGKNNIIKIFFSEKEIKDLKDTEEMVRNLKPEYEDNFEEEIIKCLKKSKNLKILKIAQITLLFLSLFILSILFYFKNSKVEANLQTNKMALYISLLEDDISIFDALEYHTNKDIERKKIENYVIFFIGDDYEERNGS